MFSGQGSVVIGYRWVTFGGSNACKQCADLNGREFYLNPGPGQASVSDMPHPPLHPNCGCKLMEIIDVAQATGRQGELEGEQNLGPEAQQPKESDTDEQPEVVMDSIVGLSWRSGYITSGPIYGKFCGKDWTNNKHDPNYKYAVDKRMPPQDDLDDACKAHDFLYEGQEEAKADRQLAEALAALPEDPRMWRKKPPEDKIEEARRYRKWALLYFQGAVAAREQPAKDRYEWGDDHEEGR